jgi:hypothetical protein
VQRRDLYKFVDEFILQEIKQKSLFKEQDLVDLSDGALQLDDVIILSTKFDYGCRDKHPLDLMHFYEGEFNNKLIREINSTEYAISRPKKILILYIRLFVRDPSKVAAAKKAFGRLCR